MRIGYACINLSLGDKIKVNRGMIKKTFQQKGLKYVGELAFLNILDMQKIIQWNVKNGILAYRMSSDMFPWFSEYEFNELPNYNLIKNKLFEIGEYCRNNNHRVSFHPGPFNCLGSPNNDVVLKTISELDKHSEILNLMGFSADHNTKINIHVGGHYGDKISATDRFCENFNKLQDDTKKRITVENDDKDSLYTVKELYDLVYTKIKIPIVFDYLHHEIKNDGMGEKEALNIAISTWNNIEPVVHYSSSKKLFEECEKNTKIQAHADYIYSKINTHGNNLCVIFEAKAKDLAVIKYLKS